jgi:hypothetical protein
LVEQRTENPRVGSSILPLATKFKGLASARPFSFLRFARQADTIIGSGAASAQANLFEQI